MPIQPFHTTHYQIIPRDSDVEFSLLAPRELAISQVIDWQHADDLYFQDPGLKWEQIPESEIVVVGRSDWATARLFYLIASVNPDLDLTRLGHAGTDAWHVQFDVLDGGQSVADLVFVIAKGVVGWSGQADSYFHSSQICEELQALMLEQPRGLATCGIRVPGRKTLIGWTGKRFHSQKRLKRPAYYDRFHRQNPSDEPARSAAAASAASDATIHAEPRSFPESWTFSIDEYPLADNARERNYSRRDFRFTDIWPPVELWSDCPNWRYAHDEESRSDQDETTLKPCAQQQVIDGNAALTAADVYLANDDCFPALMQLNHGDFSGLVCFAEESIWEFRIPPQRANLRVCTRLTDAQRPRFPLRVVSRLSRSKKPTDFICVVVDEYGRVQPCDA